MIDNKLLNYLELEGAKKYLINVMGPTAVGKTSSAILLAKEFQSEIFSSDSRQIYREMNIGTAKVTAVELKEVKHHLINHLSISDDYSAGTYESDVIKALSKYYQNSNVAILCGGTGLYIDAVISGLDKFPSITTEAKQKVESIFSDQGIKGLQSKLKKLDPEYFDIVDSQNSRRLIRALEVICASGEKYSSFLNQEKPKRNFTTVNILLERPREELYQRINLRVEQMFKEGLIEEAKALYPHKEKRSLQTVGYQELFAHFDNQYDLEMAKSEIQKNSRRYAKRQITWFKKYDAFKAHPDSIQDILEFVKTQITF